MNCIACKFIINLIDKKERILLLVGACQAQMWYLIVKSCILHTEHTIHHRYKKLYGSAVVVYKISIRFNTKIFIILALLRRRVQRMAGPISAAKHLGNTASKNHRSGGEQLATLCPIGRIWYSNQRPASPIAMS